MSRHSYTRIWLHLVWSTYMRREMLFRSAAHAMSEHLHSYAFDRRIDMRINFVNPDHVHALIDLPTNFSVENVMHLLKGESSHWMNESGYLDEVFQWGRGYGVFSVSHSHHPAVCRYIANQEIHHRGLTFEDELRMLVDRCGLEWRDDA